MRNFGRVVRLALQYRFSFIAAIGCALMVGLLWGANITVVYPFVEVVFKGESLHDWVDQRIADCRAKQAEDRATIDRTATEIGKASEAQKPVLRSEQSTSHPSIVGRQRSSSTRSG